MIIIGIAIGVPLGAVFVLISQNWGIVCDSYRWMRHGG